MTFTLQVSTITPYLLTRRLCYIDINLDSNLYRPVH